MRISCCGTKVMVGFPACAVALGLKIHLTRINKFMSVILGGAKDLLLSYLKTKADSSLPSVAQNGRHLALDPFEQRARLLRLISIQRRRHRKPDRVLRFHPQVDVH